MGTTTGWDGNREQPLRKGWGVLERGSSEEGAESQAAQTEGLAECKLLWRELTGVPVGAKNSDAFPVTQEKHMGKDKIRNDDDCGTVVRKPHMCLCFPSPDQAAQEGIVP